VDFFIRRESRCVLGGKSRGPSRPEKKGGGLLVLRRGGRGGWESVCLANPLLEKNVLLQNPINSLIDGEKEPTVETPIASDRSVPEKKGRGERKFEKRS